MRSQQSFQNVMQFWFFSGSSFHFIISVNNKEYDMCVKVSIKDLNAKRPYNYPETIIVLNSFLCDFEFFIMVGYILVFLMD